MVNLTSTVIIFCSALLFPAAVAFTVPKSVEWEPVIQNRTQNDQSQGIADVSLAPDVTSNNHTFEVVSTNKEEVARIAIRFSFFVLVVIMIFMLGLGFHLIRSGCRFQKWQENDR